MTPISIAPEHTFDAIRWDDATDACILLDQTLLPTTERYVSISTPEEMREAIKALRVRGAPAIGIAGAYGLYLAMRPLKVSPTDGESFLSQLAESAAYLNASRPTAVNLSWALRRCEAAGRKEIALTGRIGAAVDALLVEARAIHQEDIEMCRMIGVHGQALLEDGMTVLTHCNAGALATSRYGTALSVIHFAHQAGKRISVYADETRPLLQGARLTAWELQRAGIPVTLICDNMAASIMARGKIHAVVVGTDRVAANGDVANKIGTYGVALAAQHHGIPFYVAAPTSSIDLSLATGAEIPIEERDPREITDGFGRRTAPEGVYVENPAFDVTPARFVSGIITEKGIVRAPYLSGLRAVIG